MPTLATSTSTASVALTGSAGTLRASAAWMSAGMAVYSACQWAMVAVLAKAGTVEMVGRYAFAIAMTTPVLMLAQLNLRAVLTTDTGAAHDFRNYRDLRLTAMAAAMLIIAAWSTAATDPLVILLAGLGQAVEWISDTYQGLLQREEYPRRVAASLIARAVLSLAALAAGVVAGGSLEAGLAGVLAARLAVLIFYDATIAVSGLVPAQSRTFMDSFRAQSALLRIALPLGVVLVLGSLTVNVPRYFIADHQGSRDLGIFSAAASLAAAGNLFVNAVGQAVTPRMARLFSTGDRAGFLRLAFGLSVGGALLALIGLIATLTAGALVLSIVYRPEYAIHSDVLISVMAATGIGYVASLLGYSITAARRFREQVPLQIAVLAATVLTAWLLVPSIGLQGAAAAIAAGSAVQAVGEGLILVSAVKELRPGETYR